MTALLPKTTLISLDLRIISVDYKRKRAKLFLIRRVIQNTRSSTSTAQRARKFFKIQGSKKLVKSISRNFLNIFHSAEYDLPKLHFFADFQSTVYYYLFLMSCIFLYPHFFVHAFCFISTDVKEDLVMNFPDWMVGA